MRRDRRSGQRAHDLAVDDHQKRADKADELGEFGADDNHASARVRHRANGVVDVVLGPNVDSLVGLVQEEQPIAVLEPPRHDHFLLIAAAEFADERIDGRHLRLDLSGLLDGARPELARRKKKLFSKLTLGREILSSMLRSRRRPSAKRSSGTKATPRFSISLGLLASIVLPSIETVPRVGGISPKMVLRSSDFPAPSGPVSQGFRLPGL